MTDAQKIALFRRCFSGLDHVYGTYVKATGHVSQAKRPVTDEVIRAHLCGRQPYGVYLLVADKTRAIAADFDHDDLQPPMEFVRAAKNYGIDAYIERSKSKGYHAWIFFDEQGVLAAKARRVVLHILSEIKHPHTEVFPKQDRLDAHNQYGNFINAPLFGPLVPEGRAVFVDPADPTKPAPDQWTILEQVQRIPERVLDEIISINDLNREPTSTPPPAPAAATAPVTASEALQWTFGLPPCVQRMLAEGVTANQRVACFRLAVNLKRIGLPYDLAITILQAWAGKNRPTNGKRIITPAGIEAQAKLDFCRF
jgi:hypothetical protein